MQVIVKARHIRLSERLKAYAEEKLGLALMHIFDRPAAKIEIELTSLGEFRDGANQECRVMVFMPKGKTINIHEVDDNIYKAVDLAHDRLLSTVKRERGRRRQAHRTRKAAEKQRQRTARLNLTVPPELWEIEVREYEQAQARAHS